MSVSGASLGETASDAPNDEVIASLRNFLAADAQFPPVRDIRRAPSEYRSSFALEEITVTFVDGRMISVMFKDLNWNSLTSAGQRAKPAVLYDPAREIEVYRRVLSGHSLGTARCYGAVVDPSRDRHWLFMEKAAGAELYQIGELETWGHAARWLAALHNNLEVLAAAQSSEVLPGLVRYDAAYFRQWIDRAVQFASKREDAHATELLTEISRGYDDVVRVLTSLPVSFIHGEFYASNVLVDTAVHPPRVYAVDWEMAGIGPGAIDLAAMVVGNWTTAQRWELIDAYRSGLPADHPWANDPEEISHTASVARLHLAVQWLGWSPDWTPPAHQAYDWLEEAVGLSERMGLL